MQTYKRIPVLGIERTPVVGFRKAILVENKELNWNEVYDKLVNYIKFASKQVSEQYQTSVMDSSEDLFQEGQVLLYHCYNLYSTKSLAEFCMIFKASLWRKLRGIGKKQSFTQVDIEDAYDLGYTEDVVSDIYNEYKLQHLAAMLAESPIALTILKEFINPSPRTMWEAEMDIARRDTLRLQNYKISVPKTVKIRSCHIQRAMEISKVKFNESYRLMKDCVNAVYGNVANF